MRLRWHPSSTGLLYRHRITHTTTTIKFSGIRNTSVRNNLRGRGNIESRVQKGSHTSHSMSSVASGSHNRSAAAATSGLTEPFNRGHSISDYIYVAMFFSLSFHPSILAPPADCYHQRSNPTFYHSRRGQCCVPKKKEGRQAKVIAHL